jgi:hypothetical protein
MGKTAIDIGLECRWMADAASHRKWDGNSLAASAIRVRKDHQWLLPPGITGT